jgi:lysylphosphatidylglycerol synthetase-like protein (DUF2156 family)
VVAWSTFFAASLVLFGFLSRSWLTLLVISLVYVVLTLAEKIAYGRAVLAYKMLIQKLRRRLAELEQSDER